LWDDQERHAEVRSAVVAWLLENASYQIDETTRLSDFLDRSTYGDWNRYCRMMAQVHLIEMNSYTRTIPFSMRFQEEGTYLLRTAPGAITSP
jgi:hypothetical protein